MEKMQIIGEESMEKVVGGKDHLSEAGYKVIRVGDRFKWEDGWGWDEAIVECVEAPSEGRYARFRVVEMLNDHTTFSAAEYSNVKVGDLVYLSAFYLDTI